MVFEVNKIWYSLKNISENYVMFKNFKIKKISFSKVVIRHIYICLIIYFNLLLRIWRYNDLFQVFGNICYVEPELPTLLSEYQLPVEKKKLYKICSDLYVKAYAL